MFLFVCASAQAQWSTAKLSQGRSLAYPVVVGRKAFFIGGEIQNSGGNYSKTVDIYNDSTGTWTSLNLTFATTDYLNAPAIACNGHIFVIQTGEARTSVINIINAETETVTTATLSLARTNLALGTVGDWVVFAGGNTTDLSDRVDIYNTRTKTWSKAALSVARSFGACAAIGDKLFIAGGILKSTASNRVDIFDAATGTWDTASLKVPRGMITAVKVGNKLVFAGGGVPDFIYYTAADVYDAETDTWTSAQLSQEVFANTLKGAVAGNQALFTGGRAPNNVDLYDANTGTWKALTSPTSHQLNPVVASGNKVFFAGGLNNSTGQVDIYNTATGQWTNGGNLSVVRYYAAGAAVGNKLLFAGGINNSTVVDIYTLPPSGATEPSVRAFEGSLAPNPAKDHITLRFPSAVSGRLRLFDAQGSLVWSQDIQQTNQYTWSLAPLPAGRYTWHWADSSPSKSGSGQIVILK